MDLLHLLHKEVERFVTSIDADSAKAVTIFTKDGLVLEIRIIKDIIAVAKVEIHGT